MKIAARVSVNPFQTQPGTRTSQSTSTSAHAATLAPQDTVSFSHQRGIPVTLASSPFGNDPFSSPSRPP